MRRALAAATIVAAVACQRSSAEKLTGTVLGQSFSPVDTAAVVSTVAACDMSGSTLQVANLALGLRDAAGLCTSAEQPCLGKPNARTVALLLMTFGPNAQQPIGPGRYEIVLDGSGLKPNANGAFVYGVGFAVRTDATCAEAAPPVLASGAVDITSVSPSVVKGRVDLSFADGGRLAGAFEAPVCGFHPTACALMTSACTGVRSCQ